ncbi:MAG: hypothetical protein ACFFD4_12400 [Candidatus Odinarchaeota archaeon]
MALDSTGLVTPWYSPFLSAVTIWNDSKLLLTAFSCGDSPF